MKTISTLFVAGCLVATAPLALACDVRHHGGHGDKCAMEMDKNGDGAISKKEFDTFHNEQFKKLDANHDGKLTQDEMESMHDMHDKMGGMHEGMREPGKDPFDARFDETDINHDGALSKDEAEIGMPMLFKRFDEIDANKDGKITKEEVIASVKSMHEKMHPQPADAPKSGK